jgi:membrane protease subunit HflK
MWKHMNNPWGTGNGGNPWGTGGGGGRRPEEPPRRPSPGGGGGSGGPDLEDLLRQLQQKLRPFFAGGAGGGGGSAGSGRQGLLLAGLVFLLLWLSTGLYRVQPDQQGVVLRFGAYVRTTQPGLRFHLPYPIESVKLPYVTRENRLEIGSRPTSESRRGKDTNRDDRGTNIMLTGDENLVDIDFTVLWRIGDPEKFLFRLQDPEKTIQMVSQSAMREIIGQTAIQKAFTEGRNRIETDVQSLMQRLLDEYQSGITISQVQLQAVDPPSQVVDAFNEVQRARADMERMANEAEGYRNDILPRARGEAAKFRQDAAAYREQVINAAKGDAERYLSVYNAYKSSREVTRERMYLETMEQVLKNARKVVVDPSASSHGVVPYLPLNGLGNGSGGTPASNPPKTDGGR